MGYVVVDLALCILCSKHCGIALFWQSALTTHVVLCHSHIVIFALFSLHSSYDVVDSLLASTVTIP